VKAAALIAVAVAVLQGSSVAAAERLEAAVDASGLLAARRLVAGMVWRLLSLDAHKLHELGAACLAYAAVFTVEGVGLVRCRPWAEWLIVVVTSSFVPLEIYETVRHFGWGKAATLAINVAIVAVLVVRIRSRRRSRTSG
jgi:uncharacterized membrane protein (DUF2068 family)